MKALISIVVFLSFILQINAQDEACNCCTSKYSEFDFWIGKWDVINKNGELAGTNTIDKIQENCIIRENWESSKGKYTGTSYNFFNSKTNQWEQLWLDNQGGSLKLKGERIGNQMILSSDVETNKKGKSYYNRITWTLNDDGSVRQLWEVIVEDTVSQVAFDGLYKKTE